jgi:hypothetical protein
MGISHDVTSYYRYTENEVIDHKKQPSVHRQNHRVQELFIVSVNTQEMSTNSYQAIL